ncbi:unnamed protein product [Hydatigera taeniaeformis]|uniref:ANAPC4_WD40 domain-containing protein n=1 Tax=Hydatigena taeniaeformis TaxID=6205 RepID=A0A0R3WYG9_HYDTA|nr:unnamed protein product [Hydatigera taeniaeformis]
MSTSAAPSSSTPTFASLGETEAVDQPVVWFHFFANLEHLQKCTEWRARLAWLSAGRDGLICGRSLAEDQWALSLLVHKFAEITDVDVDPDGRWIAIGTTDGTVSDEKNAFAILDRQIVFEYPHHLIPPISLVISSPKLHGLTILWIG